MTIRRADAQTSVIVCIGGVGARGGRSAPEQGIEGGHRVRNEGPFHSGSFTDGDRSQSTAFHLKQAPSLRSGRGPVAETVTGPELSGLVAR